MVAKGEGELFYTFQIQILRNIVIQCIATSTPIPVIGERFCWNNEQFEIVDVIARLRMKSFLCFTDNPFCTEWIPSTKELEFADDSRFYLN